MTAALPLDDKRLAEIAARAEAATPGPWDFMSGSPGVQYVGDENGRFDAHIRYEEADAEFVAFAREDIPALLAEVARLAGVSEALGDEIQATSLALRIAAAEIAGPEIGVDRMESEYDRLMAAGREGVVVLAAASPSEAQADTT